MIPIFCLKYCTSYELQVEYGRVDDLSNPGVNPSDTQDNRLSLFSP